jgi:large subunit ribosomal protein L5
MSETNINNKYIPRALKLYRETIAPDLQKKFDVKSTFAIPKLLKIVVNMGVGEAKNDSKLCDKAAEELGRITGQKPKICRSKKPISNFKLREDAPIGCCVTLRGSKMYEFFDRFITVASPRIRDFRGFPAKAFDGNGNYNFGLTEQSIFPEIELDRVTRTQGMNISIHTTAKTDEQAKALMKGFGFPFRVQ